jgi:hypothetical protein
VALKVQVASAFAPSTGVAVGASSVKFAYSLILIMKKILEKLNFKA